MGPHAYNLDISVKFGETVKAKLINGNEVHISTDTGNIIELCRFIYSDLGCRLLSVICNDERQINGMFVLRYVFGKENGEDIFFVATANIDDKDACFPTLTGHIPSASLYEREIKDMFGLVPKGSPDQRPLLLHSWPEGNYPLRKDFDIKTKVPKSKEEYPFLKVNGDGICEIPVGPVHAGIIEPGHFRFSTLGESIINLETRLFYTHKGVEKLAEQMPLEDVVLLSERIAGDESVANSTALCQAIEKIAKAEVPKKAAQTRTVCAEMERIYNHLGTLAGLSTDAGFAFGAARLNILKEKMMNLNEKTSGSRLLFGVNQVGGVKIDLTDANKKMILSETESLGTEFYKIFEFLRKKSSFIDRLKNTVTITKEDAIGFGIIGVAARCVGIDVDTRKDHPYANYSALHLDKYHDTPYHKMEHEVEMQKRNGDALSRFMLRAEEIQNSIMIIQQTLPDLENTQSLRCEIGHLEPYLHALGYSESHRGQTMHWVMVGKNNSIYRYKIRTASFCNWKIIEQAVLNDIVADFPLVNKSLDLSYSGNDL
ncbi:MAG TPA: NADH-quinone oxidoreductase subunit C [Candidatus Nitrosotenuis sp.]|nr:NADH-quinone oxidoreductase subunit C [Candidatus Nitrosotenuis sp.]